MRDLGLRSSEPVASPAIPRSAPGTRANGVPSAAGAGCDNRLTMPIYEYRCRNGHTFEVFQSMSEDPVEKCEECGAPVERVFHPVAVHFKGSGFYTTDYAKKGAKKAESDGRGGRTRPPPTAKKGGGRRKRRSPKSFGEEVRLTPSILVRCGVVVAMATNRPQRTRA